MAQRTPDNYFAETENAASNPVHFCSGIGPRRSHAAGAACSAIATPTVSPRINNTMMASTPEGRARRREEHGVWRHGRALAERRRRTRAILSTAVSDGHNCTAAHVSQASGPNPAGAAQVDPFHAARYLYRLMPNGDGHSARRTHRGSLSMYRRTHRHAVDRTLSRRLRRVLAPSRRVGGARTESIQERPMSNAAMWAQAPLFFFFFFPPRPPADFLELA